MKQIILRKKQATDIVNQALRAHFIARGLNPSEYVKQYKKDGEVLVSDMPLNGSLDKILEKHLPERNYKIREYDYSGN